jgi:TonB-dependent starch-binding outer membrane protein SusC
MKKILLFGLLVLYASLSASAQQRSVTGKVTSSADGSPLPGVNVLIKGSSNGTVTDVDGLYKIDGVSDSDILLFSFIGLITQEIPVGSRATLDVSLAEDVSQLNEVVITGYGEQEARAVTGSVSTVMSDKINLIPMADVSRTLQGNVAGLLSTGGSGTPGAATQVRIRGIGSAVASAEPLYIVDGIPIQADDLTANTATANPLANINPNDIENVTVLKDAAATAVYGSRG